MAPVNAICFCTANNLQEKLGETISKRKRSDARGTVTPHSQPREGHQKGTPAKIGHNIGDPERPEISQATKRASARGQAGHQSMNVSYQGGKSTQNKRWQDQPSNASA
jgi:hypothetical protein